LLSFIGVYRWFQFTCRKQRQFFLNRSSNMISDFQLVLIGIIAVIIVGVIVYNRWQESLYRRRAEKAFQRDGSDTSPDVLFSDKQTERVEPSFGAINAATAAEEDDALNELTAPILGSSPHDDVRPNYVTSASELLPTINAEIDTVAMILADVALDADRYVPMILQSQSLAKHVLWEGLVGGLWQPIDPTMDEKYRELRAGLQLADRSGVVDATVLTAFDDAMTNFAASLDAVSQREDITDAHRRAQMVDAFCADTDIEIAINIIGKSGVTFAATKLRGLAEAKGLVALPAGEYAAKDDLGRMLYTLRNGNPAESSALRTEQPYFTQLTFALDVPRTPQPAQVFERMYALALQFADVLQGELVDDNKKTLTAQAKRSINDTIHEITGEMQQKGVAPGSATALRLYS
jgi:hypothetical protein